jgi:diguanylate cyclase (GGDEF)-like protein
VLVMIAPITRGTAVMKALEAIAYRLLWHSPSVSVLVLLTAALLIASRIQQQRGVGAQRNSLLEWFSHLYTFSQNLGESSYPREMSEAALSGVLRTFDVSDGLVLLQGEYEQGLSHLGARGLSAHAIEVLSSEPLRGYLASASEKWGNLLVVPDLRKSEPLQEWRRGPEFRQVIAALQADGLKSLLIIGLVTRGRTYGALLAGRRKLRTFKPKELLLAAAIGSQVSMALDNWSLVRAGQRHDENLRTLGRVGRAMRETLDLNEQMAALRQHMGGLLEGCDFALAMQDSPEGPLQTVVPFEQYRDAGPAAMAVSAIQEEVAKTRAPRLIAETWQWTKYASSYAPGAPRPRTWCGVPIHFSDGSMGVLEVANFQRERALTVQQFELVRVLANEAAGAFENTRTLQKEQRRASHLALLNEIGRKATSVLNPRDLLANLCVQVRNAFGHDLARVEICDRNSDELVVEAEAGYGNELVGHRTPLGKELSGAAADRHEAVVANWIPSDAQCSMLAPGVRSSVSLPLEYQNELMGVLTLESRRGHAFPAQDVLMLKTLADQVSIALHNAREYQNALEEAITDGLTGLKTHGYFMETLEQELRRSQRTGRPFSVIMMDLDQFKSVNDQYGHVQGDRVLNRVARVLMDQARKSSVIARYGGDEFSILIPDATLDQAQRAAERLRENIEKEPLLANYHVTASFGIATYPEHGTTHRAILHVADSGMYLAKHENGNRVRVATLVQDSGQVEADLSVQYNRKFSTKT